MRSDTAESRVCQGGDKVPQMQTDQQTGNKRKGVQRQEPIGCTVE